MPSEIIPPLNSSRRFGIKVILYADSKRMETEYLDGSFKFLKSSWEFIEKDNLGCDVNFEFKSRLLQKVIGVFLMKACSR